MSKASYWQRGESLDYKNATETSMEGQLRGTDRREPWRRRRMLADSWKKISRQKNPRRTVKADQTARKNRQHTLRRALRRQTQQQGTIRSS